MAATITFPIRVLYGNLQGTFYCAVGELIADGGFLNQLAKLTLRSIPNLAIDNPALSTGATTIEH